MLEMERGYGPLACRLATDPAMSTVAANSHKYKICPRRFYPFTLTLQALLQPPCTTGCNIYRFTSLFLIGREDATF